MDIISDDSLDECRSIATINKYLTMNQTINLLIVLLLLGLYACAPKTTESMVKETSTVEEVTKKAEPLTETVSETMAAVPVDTRLTSGKLSNGIHYYIQKNAKPENRAALRLAVNAGSLLEDEDQQGLAHFVEHMAFNGTENFAKSELVDYLESVGARFGPDLNAYTSFDETVYMLQVRTDSSELFEKGMQILRDWSQDVTFEDEEIDKERGVVESEWRSRLSSDQRMQKKTLPVMYRGSRYAERLPIGDPDIIKNAEYSTVKRFYKDWYRPDLMAVVVVGDVDIVSVEAQIKSLFGDIPAAMNARERVTYDVPYHQETLVSIASDKEASFTRLQVAYKHEKKHTKTLEEYRELLVRGLYNSMMGGRLTEISKQPDPPFVFASSGYSGDVGELDTYSSNAFIPEGKASAALESVLTENRRVLLHGYTSGEFERAKENLMQGAEKQFKEMDKSESGNIAMRYVYKYLDEIATPGPDQVLELYKQYLPTIQIEEVNMLASQWIRNENRVVILTGPEKKDVPLPSEEDVFAMLSKVDNMIVEPYVDDVIDAPLFDAVLSPVEIVKTTKYDNVDIEYLELANGVSVYLKKTDFKNDEILMSAISPGGTSLYSDEEYFNASNSASVVSEGGIGVFSTTQLEKILAGKSVGVRPYVGGMYEGMSGSASPDDAEIMFQLIYKYFKESRIDEKSFNSFVAKQQGLYKNIMSDPRYFFSDYVSRLKYDNHPRVGFPSSEDWLNLDYSRALKIYQERFADASDFTFSFIGNFERGQMLNFIQTYLGNLPSTKREENWKDVGRRPVNGVVKDRFKNGEAPKTNVHMYYHGDYEWSNENNYILNSTVEYLRIKLREELREDLGGVYGVGIRGGPNKDPYESYGITISFNSDPPMTDTLVQAAHDVIKRALEEGPNEVDMTKIKETQKQSRIKDLKRNRFWQSIIRNEVLQSRGFDGVLLNDREAKINGLTAHQIKSAVGTYFNDNQYIEIIMDPEVVESN
ncbi:MAG: zinc protease [Saprospiraceae bacterium]|jgi:zinc protease